MQRTFKNFLLSNNNIARKNKKTRSCEKICPFREGKVIKRLNVEFIVGRIAAGGRAIRFNTPSSKPGRK
jgi:hypothetical protein